MSAVEDGDQVVLNIMRNVADGPNLGRTAAEKCRDVLAPASSSMIKLFRNGEDSPHARLDPGLAGQVRDDPRHPVRPVHTQFAASTSLPAVAAPQTHFFVWMFGANRANIAVEYPIWAHYIECV